MRGWKPKHPGDFYFLFLGRTLSPDNEGMETTSVPQAGSPRPGRTLSPDNEGMETGGIETCFFQSRDRRTLSPDNEGMETIS